jgi:zinc transporter
MQTIQLRPSSLNSDSEGAAAAQGEAWIDIELGDDEGRRWLANESGLDDRIVNRLLEPTRATYWRRFAQGLHFHTRTELSGGENSARAVIDFGIWLDADRVITVRRGMVPPLDRAAQACSKGAGPSSSWELVVSVLSEGLSQLEEILHDLTATIDRLEEDVLTGAGDPPIHRVAELQRRLVYARRFRVPLTNLVSFVSSQPGPALDAALRDELEGIGNDIAQQKELLDLSIDRASALQGLIRDQISDSMNSATYRFTWVATVFLPLSFLTGLLGINVAGIPGDHDPLAFWVVCSVLSVIAALWGLVVGRVTRRGRSRSGSRDP